jgi:hypothetical protein
MFMGNSNDVKNLLALYGRFTEKPGLELFQYSRSATLKSVTEKKKLWATSHLYLNDPTEFKHGMEIFLSSLLNVFDKTFSDKSFIHTLFEELYKDVNDPPIKFFISSFTENEDLLSQWRGYGDGGSGLAMGFNPNAILHEDSAANAFWAQVIYDDALKNKIVAAIMVEVSKIIATWVKLDPITLKNVIVDFLVAFIQIATVHSLKFKHKSWSEEKEWRYVELVFPSVNRQIFTRDRGSDLVEFVEVDLKPNFLKSVVVGPRSNFINQKNAIFTLCGNTIVIKKSEIPWI